MQDAAKKPQPPANWRATSIGDLRLIAACSIVYLLDGLVHTIMGPLAPEIAGELKLSHAQLGSIFSAKLIGQCFGLVTIPLLVRRLGHRRITIYSLVGFGLFQSVSGLVSDSAVLFAVRLATGIFVGGAMPSCLAIVTAATPPARRGLAISLLFTGYGIGAMLAGMIASASPVLGGWRLALLVTGLVCLLSAALTRRWLVEPQTRSQGNDAIEGGRLLAILSRRYLIGTLLLWLMFIALLTISYCLSSWLPTMLVDVGRENWIAAMSVSIFTLGGLVSAIGIGLLIDKFGATLVLSACLVIASGLFVVIGQYVVSLDAVVLLSLLGAAGFFFYGAYGGVNVVLATYYPEHLRALGIGWTKSIGRVGTVIAPILIGLALSAGIGEAFIISLFAVPSALAAATVVAIGAMMTGEGARAET